jgi:hypothetical protein
MKAREADLALALEPLASVAAVYATEPHAGGAPPTGYDFIVELRPYTGRTLADAHYAMRAVLSHEECGRVLLRDADAHPVPEFAARAHKIVLDDDARRGALVRAETRARLPASDSSQVEESARLTALIVDAEEKGAHSELAHLIAKVAPAARVDRAEDNARAFRRMAVEWFDVVVWDATQALGDLVAIGSFVSQHPRETDGLVFVGSKDALGALRQHFGAWVVDRLYERPATAETARAFLVSVIRRRGG